MAQDSWMVGTIVEEPLAVASPPRTISKEYRAAQPLGRLSRQQKKAKR